jgi:hypothetical protein
MITEKDLIELGFERNDETAENSGTPCDWHYYTLEIGIGIYNKFCLSSNSNDEVGDDGWKVYLFNNNSFEFTERYQLEKLIETLKYNLIK